MDILNTFCAWIIVLCSFTFIKIVFEQDKMTRFHVLDRLVLRIAIVSILIAEILIGVKCDIPSIEEVLLNNGLALVYLFLNYQYYSKKKW